MRHSNNNMSGEMRQSSSQAFFRSFVPRLILRESKTSFYVLSFFLSSSFFLSPFLLSFLSFSFFLSIKRGSNERTKIQNTTLLAVERSHKRECTYIQGEPKRLQTDQNTNNKNFFNHLVEKRIVCLSACLLTLVNSDFCKNEKESVQQLSTKRKINVLPSIFFFRRVRPFKVTYQSAIPLLFKTNS